MNKFIYIFYRFKSLYKYKNSSDNWIHAFILVGAIFLIHILTVLLFAQTIFNRDFVGEIRFDNGFIDRFILFPLLIVPIYLVLFIYYRKNKIKIMDTLRNFRSESDKERKRKGFFVAVYLTVSVLLFFFSMISSALFK